jgi:hypothetical protein
MKELDKTKALTLMKDFKVYLSHDRMKELRKWFERKYKHRFELWEYCHRLHSGINTNMGTESLFSQLKMHSFKRKHVPRLDESIKNVTEFLENKLLNYMNQKRYHTYQDTNRYQAHKDAVVLWRQHSVTFTIDENVIRIRANGKFTNNVYILSDNCQAKENCLDFCSESGDEHEKCLQCVHMIQCDCEDHAIRATFCIHLNLAMFCLSKSSKTLAMAVNCLDNIDRLDVADSPPTLTENISPSSPQNNRTCFKNIFHLQIHPQIHL